MWHVLCVPQVLWDLKVRPAVVSMSKRFEGGGGGGGKPGHQVDADHLNAWLRLGRAENQPPPPPSKPAPAPVKWTRKKPNRPKSAKDKFAALDCSSRARGSRGQLSSSSHTLSAGTLSAEGTFGSKLRLNASGEHRGGEHRGGEHPPSTGAAPPGADPGAVPSAHLGSHLGSYPHFGTAPPFVEQSGPSTSSIDPLDRWLETLSPGVSRREEMQREKRARAEALRAQIDPRHPDYRQRWYRRDWRLAAPLAANALGSATNVAPYSYIGSRMRLGPEGGPLSRFEPLLSASASFADDDVSVSSSIPPAREQQQARRPPWQPVGPIAAPPLSPGLGLQPTDSRPGAPGSRPSSSGRLPPRSCSASALLPPAPAGGSTTGGFAAGGRSPQPRSQLSGSGVAAHPPVLMVLQSPEEAAMAASGDGALDFESDYMRELQPGWGSRAALSAVQPRSPLRHGMGRPPAQRVAVASDPRLTSRARRVSGNQMFLERAVLFGA